MRYYVISGEASGDLHGANLIKELRRKDPSSVFRAWGGERMQKEGAEIVKHYRDLAFMGFTEVILNLPTILKNIKWCKQDISSWKPDAVILIDYPGFNLRIAEFVKALGVPVIYYISPQIWAWKQKRVFKIKKIVDLMLVILPFESDFYNRFDYKTVFVGHPLLDELKDFVPEKLFPDKEKIIALLPGSRKQEISVKLPLMLQAVESFKDYKAVIAGAPSIDAEFYSQFTKGKNADVIHGKTYSVLKSSHAALVTSGTATLETALLNVPEVVCYKGGGISYQIAKRLVKVKYISLVNLIMDREVVKELIQYDLTPENMKDELNRILSGPGREKQLNDFEELRKKLGGPGASERAAESVVSYLKQK